MRRLRRSDWHDENLKPLLEVARGIRPDTGPVVGDEALLPLVGDASGDLADAIGNFELVSFKKRGCHQQFVIQRVQPTGR